ncbi:5703_t:CDS:2, partial [Ambispora leptoticha]
EKHQQIFSEAYQVEKRRREEYEKRQNQEIVRKNIAEIVDNCINTVNTGRSIEVEEVLNEVRECLEQLDLSSTDSNDSESIIRKAKALSRLNKDSAPFSNIFHTERISEPHRRK